MTSGIGLTEDEDFPLSSIFSLPDTPTKIQDDEELQNFAHELVLPIKKGGVGINVRAGEFCCRLSPSVHVCVSQARERSAISQRVSQIVGH